MGEQRERDADNFCHLDELRELTGYTPKRLGEITRRYRRRCDKFGRKRRVFYLADRGIVNDEFTAWLLEHRFRAPLVQARPAATITLKQTEQHGVSYNSVRRLIKNGELEAFVCRGRYYVEKAAVKALAANFTQAPANWLPVVCLTSLAGRTRQAVYGWVKRRKAETRMFVHPKRAHAAQHLCIQDALGYLIKALGSAHEAIRALKQHAPRYFRALSKKQIDLFSTDYADEGNDATTLEVTLITGEVQPPPLNPTYVGHGLLQPGT